MSIPFEWEWIERHKDFIANMLDLVSFMLVTPEILIRVKPEFGAIQRFLFSSAFFLITSYLLATLLAAIGITTARSFYYVGGIVGVVFIYFASAIMAEIGEILAEHLSRHLFGLGIVMFMLARLFLLMIASHSLYGFP
jgi:hypothetical protein